MGNRVKHQTTDYEKHFGIITRFHLGMLLCLKLKSRKMINGICSIKLTWSVNVQPVELCVDTG